MNSGATGLEYTKLTSNNVDSAYRIINYGGVTDFSSKFEINTSVSGTTISHSSSGPLLIS